MLLKMEIDRMIVSDLAELGLISRTLADRRLCGEYMSEVRASTTQTINKFVTALDIEPDFGVSLLLGLSRGTFYSLFLAAAGMTLIMLAPKNEAKR